MSFLEVLLSAVLLTLVTGMILAAIQGVVGSQVRQHQKLGAAEVANRLILEYIDDQGTMPQAGLPVRYGRDFYRWEIDERPLTLTPAKEREPAGATARPNTGINLDRLKTVRINVWLSDERGGGPDPGAPSFALSRIVDPIFGQLRNPDTADHIMKDPVLRQKFLDAVTGMAASAGTRPTGVTPRTTPRPTSPTPGRGTPSRFDKPSPGGKP
jgi:type II secretory pathway pseudopilin PulG